MFTGLPPDHCALRVLHHHVAVRADPLPVESWLCETSLTSPEITFARHQTVADKTIEKRRTQRLRFAIALRVRRQQRLDVARVIKKVSVDPEKSCANNVAVISAARHKTERVAIEVAHHAHDQ